MYSERRTSASLGSRRMHAVINRIVASTVGLALGLAFCTPVFAQADSTPAATSAHNDNQSLFDSLLATATPRALILASMIVAIDGGDRDATDVQAIELRERARGMAPDDAFVQWFAGSSLARDDAIAQSARDLVRIDPDNGAAWVLMLNTAAAAGDDAGVTAALARIGAAPRYDEQLGAMTREWLEAIEVQAAATASTRPFCMIPAMPKLRAPVRRSRRRRWRYRDTIALERVRATGDRPNCTSRCLCRCGRTGRRRLHALSRSSAPRCCAMPVTKTTQRRLAILVTFLKRACRFPKRHCVTPIRHVASSATGKRRRAKSPSSNACSRAPTSRLSRRPTGSLRVSRWLLARNDLDSARLAGPKGGGQDARSQGEGWRGNR